MTNATPTERMIIELARQSERYRFALHGCLVGARNGVANELERKAALIYIEKTARKALYGNGEETE